MITFIGDFQCKVDEKGRIVLSAALKKAMADETRFVVRKDLFEECLVLYPYSYWEEELLKLRKKLNPYNREHKSFLRDFFKSTVEVSLDANGSSLSSIEFILFDISFAVVRLYTEYSSFME